MYSVVKPTWVIQWIFEARNDDITVARASNFLAYVLKSGQDSVIFANNKIQIFELGAHPDLCEIPADRVKIAFCGGPPGKYTTYKGTLLSLLVDRCVWEMIHGDIRMFDKLTKLVGRGYSIGPDDWYKFDEDSTVNASEIPCPSI